MEVDLALLADAATIDSSGKLNILGVFDRISVKQFPARHGRVCLVLRFRAGLQEVGRHEVEIVLRDPEGGELVRADGNLQLGGGPGSAFEGIRVPQVLNFDGLVFEGAGRYAFDVKVDGEHHASIPLRVSRSGAEA
jgi:hypothetical protein